MLAPDFCSNEPLLRLDYFKVYYRLGGLTQESIWRFFGALRKVRNENWVEGMTVRNKRPGSNQQEDHSPFTMQLCCFFAFNNASSTELIRLSTVFP